MPARNNSDPRTPTTAPTAAPPPSQGRTPSRADASGFPNFSLRQLSDPLADVSIAGGLRFNFHEDGHCARRLPLGDQRITEVVHQRQPFLDHGRGRLERAFDALDRPLEITTPLVNARKT